MHPSCRRASGLYVRAEETSHLIYEEVPELLRQPSRERRVDSPELLHLGLIRNLAADVEVPS